ncbi:DNA, complete genome [Streptococcus pneumoniae]|nr:DNA, complete genome [Streptococcus pneumoniae]VNW45522.1 DNA, complete genome [Streptococcus pneumoniae]
MKEKLNEFLKFRSQFTKREWIEINQVVEARLNEKADQLELDDSDVEIISKRLGRSI